MDNAKQALKTLYQALADRPLDPIEDKDWYEPYVEKLADGDPIAELLTDIDFSDAQSLHLVSGQRGTGKSTELKRLKNLLSDADYEVFYLDILDYIADSEPVEITDFLLTATAALAQQAKERGYGDQLHESYWERMYALLTAEVKLEPLKASVKGASFSADIQARLKQDNNFKRELQRATRAHIVKFMDNIQHFVTELVHNIHKKTNQDKRIAFIVDSFEQIRGDAHSADKVQTSIAQMFSSHGDKLHLPLLHFVVTVPPYLSTAAPGVTRLSGGNPMLSLPSLHVRNQQGNTDTEALTIMRRIVYKRSSDAQRIFTDEALNDLAQASGGDLRHFLSMLRTALRKAGTRTPTELPISTDIIEQAKEAQRRDLLPITDEDVRWLHKVAQSKRAELQNMESLPLLARLFDATLIVNYRNGSNWYDIHPLVQDYVEERIATLQAREAGSE